MGNKLKFILLTLLGFSTACSTVRNGAGNDNGAKTQPEPVEEVPEIQEDSIRTIRLLYGVRRPEPRPESEVRGEERSGSAAGLAPEQPSGSAETAASEESR